MQIGPEGFSGLWVPLWSHSMVHKTMRYPSSAQLYWVKPCKETCEGWRRLFGNKDKTLRGKRS